VKPLLVAEVRKLVRPLVWGTGLAIMLFCVLITAGAANNARGGVASPRIPDICAQAATPACVPVIARAHASALAAAVATSRLAQPGQVGHVAAGMLASLPGLLLIALVAGGHWGGEWGTRTIRSLLTREGRRRRVLVAKWLTIWAAGLVTMLTCWLVLAVVGPAAVAASGLPDPGTSLWAGLGSSLASAAHAVIVLGLFAAVAVAAGTIARGQLATTALAAGSMLIALLVSGIASVGQWSPASFVQAWMGFDSSGYLPTNFWSRFAGRGPQLGAVAGLTGIAVTVVLAAAVASWRFAADVTV
jgi:ABC-type transport system involved in multi-copper enzyme maturation permease subunit